MKMRQMERHSGTWRDYQKSLRRSALRKYLLKRAPWLGLYGCASFLLLMIIVYAASYLSTHLGDGAPPKRVQEEKPELQKLSKAELHDLVRELDPGFHGENENPAVIMEGRRYTLETSIDGDLQRYISNFLDRSLTHLAAVVVVRPDTGQVLAMVNHDPNGTRSRENLCLKAQFPAASLFKIVAAAAAIESRGFTPEKTLAYRGGPYTLYKSQLKKGQGRYTNKVSFKQAFSRSINPVFGKIGIYDLGKDVLTEYADRFLFNAPIPFDLPLDTSRIEVPEDDFGLAEIASGFNKRTLISPLHAALLTAAVINKGIIMEPWLVKRVNDESGKTLYQMSPSKLASPIEEQTADKLKVLMGETTATGTCRSAFRILRRKRLFKSMDMGAKTGTINDPQNRYKFDWLTAYALPREGGGGICVAVLAVHGERLGIRAKDIGRYVIGRHFAS